MSLVSQDAALTECHLTKKFSKCQISGEQLFLHDWWRHLKPVIFLSLVDQPPGLSVHDWCPGSGLLPAVVVLYQAGDQLVWKLQTRKKENLLFITRFKYLGWWVHVCLSQSRTICWMRWKLLPWKLKACSNSTLSSTVHSSGKGVKFARSASERSTSCLCHNNMPRAWWSQKSGNQEKFRSEDRKKYKHLSFCFWCPYLLHVVSVFLLSHEDVLVHWKKIEKLLK